MDKDTLFSSFGKWIKPLKSLNIREKAKQAGQDRYVKKLSTEAYLLLFLHAELQKREGLRAIADDLLHQDFQQFLGFSSISASQLSRKHRQVDSALLAGIFYDLVGQLRRYTPSYGFRKNYRIIDSTTISLCLQKYRWATFRKTKAGIKIHLRLVFANHEDVYPDNITLTTAKPSDRSQMDTLIDESEAIYVFDRGYVDYRKFDEYCERGISFTTRLKSNAVFQILETRLLHQDSILSDSVVCLGAQHKRMKHVLRLVEVLDSQGNLIQIVTNRWDLTAEEIGEIYRSRWAIELFFKWIKQHLRIKTFYGTTPNAVWNQVYLSLIAYCLLLLVKLETHSPHSLLQITRWLLVLLWQPSESWMDKILKKRSSRNGPKE